MNWKTIYKRSLGIFIFTLGVTLVTLAQNKTHTVKAGETLFNIANQHDVTVQELRDWNSLRSNELSIGQTLIVGQQDSDNHIVHTVKAQETLFSISKKYGVNISEIKLWNELTGNNLEIGQKLTIHLDKTNKNNTQNSSAKSIVVNNSTQSNTYYTVKSGDTLYKIAREHNMTIDELRQLNNLNSNTLSIGQQLTVKATSAPPSVAESYTESSPQGKFVTYQTESTQNLSEVLKQFEMTETEFKVLNPDFSSGNLQKGQKVTVLSPPSRTYSNPYRTNASLKNLGKTTASKYSASEKGETTTSGELYNPDGLTAAHSNIAMGTIMYIQNTQNNKGIYIRINDRLSGNGLKLSAAAWQALGFSSANPSIKIFQDQ